VNDCGIAATGFMPIALATGVSVELTQDMPLLTPLPAD
jgi:hypothetical protein